MRKAAKNAGLAKNCRTNVNWSEILILDSAILKFYIYSDHAAQVTL